MRKIIIRKADASDAAGKGYVHYHSWNETYTVLIDQDYLESRSLDKCIGQARKYPQNTYVALIDKRIVGFACYLESRDKDLQDAGEIMSIYILKNYYGLGIGKKLIKACYYELKQYTTIAVWVLKTNVYAINFYKHMGFEKDGNEKVVQINEKNSIVEVRMILELKI